MRSIPALTLGASLGTALAVGAVLAAVLLLHRSTQPEPPARAAAEPTIRATSVATTEPPCAVGTLASRTRTPAEAVTQARDIFTAMPPLVAYEIGSVTYVETTYGQALSVLNFNPHKLHDSIEQDFPGDTPVWVVVASGRFENKGIGSMPGPVYTTMWVATVKDDCGFYVGRTTSVLSVSSLGAVNSVPLPLPERPAPVRVSP